MTVGSGHYAFSSAAPPAGIDSRSRSNGPPIFLVVVAVVLLLGAATIAVGVRRRRHTA